jgi:hypothetical protein
MKTWELEHFNIEIMICEGQLPDITSGRGVFKKLTLVQDLNVAKGVVLGLCMMADDMKLVNDEDKDAEYNHCEEVSAEYMPAIRDSKVITK